MAMVDVVSYLPSGCHLVPKVGSWSCLSELSYVPNADKRLLNNSITGGKRVTLTNALDYRANELLTITQSISPIARVAR